MKSLYAILFITLVASQAQAFNVMEDFPKVLADIHSTFNDIKVKAYTIGRLGQSFIEYFPTLASNADFYEGVILGL